MANLSLISVDVIDSGTLTAQFTEPLDKHIGVGNITITPQLSNVPISAALTVTVSGAILQITCQPLTPLVPYIVSFNSTSTVPFKSVNGDKFLNENDINNQQLIIGPIESSNSVQDFLNNYLRDNIYNIFDPTTFVYSLIQLYTNIFSKALYDIHQVKNENYLSFVVQDEQHVRTDGPFDRLQEEAAYEVIRVGLTPTNTNALFTMPIDLFGQSDVTLLSTAAANTLLPSTTNDVNTFDINNFVLTVSNQFVSQLNSVVFTYSDARLPYTYNIDGYGYQLLDSRYDKQFGSNYALLTNNQFKLNTAILNDSRFSTNNISKIAVSYQYKDLGRIINSNSVQVSSIQLASREVIPPIVNIFNLRHAPITTSSGIPGTIGDVTFIDPNALTPTSRHPAFLYEIPFNFSAPPSLPGQYSINYVDGTVYVYGASTTNDGTGPLPPLATYNYQLIYTPNIDYTYDSDSNDLAALPTGNLINNSGTITFNYEQVLVPGIDYEANIHIESLSERILNKLLALNLLQVDNAPVTNVFRILNETSGEIYNVVRWNNDKVYFTYNNPPNVLSVTGERATFADQLNEILFIHSTLINGSSLNIFQCNLQNNNIIAQSQDCIASSINSSASFSNTTIFVSELWYDANETVTNNINRLTQIGQYMIDYVNGIVYVAVLNPSNISIGNINYKIDSITPQFPHILSVDDIYYRISLLNPKNKEFTYTSFADGSIIPSSFDISDEALLNGNIGEAYQALTTSGVQQVGAFVNAVFNPVVSNQIKSIRGIFEFKDLQNDILPLNFGPFATFSNSTITLHPFVGQEYTNVAFNVTDGYYVLTNFNNGYLSSNLTYTFTVTRLSDGYSLWNGSGVVVPGSPVKLRLPGINSPQVGDSVLVTWSISINDFSRVIVDYNKGEYYIDYSYLADEIIVSYEYGDNVLDFRKSLSVATGATYYVTYRAGALRDALLKNFGTLINIPELATFDTSFARERYRDALMAALSSFLQGPTLTAMEDLVQQISHVKPEIIESAFNVWSLGSSNLTPVGIETTGQFNLIPAVYDNGVVIDTPGQTITTPVTSNLRLENGSFECWILPEWNGLDNDANLTISIMKNNATVLADKIFIGASEYHPTYVDNSFVLNIATEVTGTPNKNKDGIFIYYDKDPNGSFYRWYCDVVDGYSDGYADDGYRVTYKIKVTTDGHFYNVKAIDGYSPPTMSITSGDSLINLFIDGYAPLDEGITFLADYDHYILDFGKDINHDRVSIYKDASGYMNFKVFDRTGNIAIVSADVSKWRAGDAHQVAAAWNLNTAINRDEIHLFIDGFEVPNIVRYGTNVPLYLNETYRTVNPEEIAGKINKNIVAGTDLVTTSGSNVVSSALNFTANNILPGAIIYINEPGFNSNGYSVTTVSGQSLTLSTTMPLSITHGNYSVNKTSLNVITEIDMYPNITVSTISSVVDGYDLSTISGSATVTSASSNFVADGIQSGYLLRIDGYDGSFMNNYIITSVSTTTLVLNTTMPITQNNLVFHIYPNNPVEIPGVRALNPSYSITETPIDGYVDYVLTLTNSVRANDLILINTLGINHKRIEYKYYQWATIDGYTFAIPDGLGDGYYSIYTNGTFVEFYDGYTSPFSDGYTNVILTQLPPPISLNQVSIDHILLDGYAIYDGYAGDGYNATLSGGILTSFQLPVDQPSLSDRGRTLAVTITSTDNIDFSVPVTVMINGYNGTSTVTETLTFSSTSQLGVAQNTVNKFLQVNYVQVSGKPKNINRYFIVMTVAEAYSITTPENSNLYPVVRFSYQTLAGITLSGSGSTITDPNHSFSSLDINNYVVISYPVSAAGTYQITAVSPDFHSATINASLSSFSGGKYQVLNATTFRSGLQNGFFVLEQANLPGVPYYLRRGVYKFDYYTYLSMKFDPTNELAYLGSDLNGHSLLNGTLDEVKITSNKLTDTRIGEVVPNNQETITKDFNSLKALTSDHNTLFLCHFDTFPFVNSADFYIIANEKEFVQSGNSVNNNFSQSLSITNKPFLLNNNGILPSQSQGTIEFWVSPNFDTQNDPNYRFYFDASALRVENVVSVNNVSVEVSVPVGQVLSVKLQDGSSDIDYFAGGRVEIDTTGAIQETQISTGTNTVVASKPILQVITVKIVGDPTNTDYFANGVIGTDQKTIFLGKALPDSPLTLVLTYQPVSGGVQTLNSQVIRLNKELPNQQTPVIVTYVPSGTQGDRISIFKDPYGYVNFDVRASDIEYVVRAPVFWTTGSWHRLKATYSVNGGQNTDTIRLFVDGYERGNILFGTGLLYGDPHVYGSTFVGSSGFQTNIILKDTFNELFIGSDFTGSNTAYALLDNLRISNIARPVYAPFGESIDVNYNSNTNAAFPVTTDLYTTYLMDFDTTLVKNTNNFARLSNKNTGNFDFTINVFDSFDIISGSTTVKNVLETLINALKGATSSVYINYLE